MPERISAVNLIIDSILPEEYRDPHRVYDKRGTDVLLTEVARKNPELYPEIAKKLGDLGRLQAYNRGETFRMDDFKPVIDRSGVFAELDAREAAIDQATQDPDERRNMRGELYGEFSDRISRETNRAALAKRNNIALTVLTGARGKEAQLRDLISTPGFYSDAKGRVIPWFIRNSFAEGLRPADFLASTYAARSAVTESKRATAQGGFLAKTLSRAAATHTVTEADCSSSNGIDLPVSEPDIRGRVLQKPAAGFPVGTVIDRKVLSKLKADEVDTVIVRSPLTCGSEHGICAKCFGVKAEGRFPKVGEHVGITAATALGEPLTQAALSMKHVVSGKGAKKEFSGLNYIQQFVESPEEFKDRSVVSSVAGRVEGVEPAPQGGHYVLVAGQKHYVPLDREITVQVGEEMEAGDSLTDGLVDTEDILKYKGLGEARNYWASRMHEMGKASAAGMDRRLFEVLARANVDHVQLDDPVEEGFLPDDTTRYSSYLHKRQIGSKAKTFNPKDAVGKWLEQPILHHTVGTKITPKIAEHINKNGYDQVFATDEEPSFKPVFVRLQQVAATSDDWLASLGGSYLSSQLQQGITRAQDTNIEENIHPVPRLAVGVDFAKNLETTGKF